MFCWEVNYYSVSRCPNPLDPPPHQVVLSPVPSRQTRRFTISTFQFLDDGVLKDTNEEVSRFTLHRSNMSRADSSQSDSVRIMDNNVYIKQ